MLTLKLHVSRFPACAHDLSIYKDGEFLEMFLFGREHCTQTPTAREAYEAADRMMRCMNAGFSALNAWYLALEQKCPLSYFQHKCEEDFPCNPDDKAPFVAEDDCDYMATGELTLQEREVLYMLWLEDGDEVFENADHYGVNKADLLHEFRQRAQIEDDLTAPLTDDESDWSGASHHTSNIAY